MAETIGNGTDAVADGEVVAAEVSDTQVSFDPALEGQDRTPRERIGDLIRRMQETGSRRLIPDATAKEVVRAALNWHC